MSNRREVLAQLAALTVLPRVRWLEQPRTADPLIGSIVAYQAGRARGDFTATEITRLALERCTTAGARWKAIDALSADAALAAAAASDDLVRRRLPLRSPIDGVPMFAKSIYDVAGLPTTGSSAEWARLFPDVVRRDSIEVQRMRSAGGVILGKTAADDFAYRGNGTSSHTGQVLNPYDAAGLKTPGGSSAGSSVAVAGGLCFVALGTDDGGSNRIPAQFTGIVGTKPTFGLVPRTGVIPTWPYLDTHGPIAHSVLDAALLLAVIAGADAADPLALAGASVDPGSLSRLSDEALRGVRLGIVEVHAPREQMTAEALAAWDRALGDLKSAGAVAEPFKAAVDRTNYRDLFAAAATERGDVKVDANSPAPTANALLRYFAGRTSDPKGAIKRGYAAYQSFYSVLPKTYEECEPLLDSSQLDDPAGRSFGRSRATVVVQLAASMKAASVEAMVYPTMPFKAPNASEQWPNVRTPLGYGNWLGLPEVSVPAGYGADGMPTMNLSVVGLPGTDAKVFAFAHAYEQQSKRFRPARPA